MFPVKCQDDSSITVQKPTLRKDTNHVGSRVQIIDHRFEFRPSKRNKNCYPLTSSSRDSYVDKLVISAQFSNISSLRDTFTRTEH